MLRIRQIVITRVSGVMLMNVAWNVDYTENKGDTIQQETISFYFDFSLCFFLFFFSSIKQALEKLDKKLPPCIEFRAAKASL